MKKIAIFICVCISFAWGQIVPQAGSMKLLAFDKKDQEVVHAMQIGNNTFFSVPSVEGIDSARGNILIRGNYIFKINTDYFNVKAIQLRPDSIDFIHIDQLFRLKHPISDQPLIGFAGQGQKLDSTLQDTVSFLFIGWVDTNLQNPFYVTNIHRKNGGYNPGWGGFIEYPYSLVKDVSVLSDSSFLLLSTWAWQGKKYRILWLFRYDINGFYVKDSLSSDAWGLQLYRDSNGNIKTFDIYSKQGVNIQNVQFNPISLGFSYIYPNILPAQFPPNSEIKGLSIQNDGDTLLCHGYIDDVYHYVYKFLDFGNGLQLWDSVFIDTLLPFHIANRRSFSALSNNYLYLVGSVSGKSGNINIIDFSWMHDTVYSGMGTNAFKVHLFDSRNLFSIGSISLGGDAYYTVRGIIALSDSVCIVYGWRFPLGDLTRTDGDAFIWKISWNSGIVTPILGDAPKFSFKIFPNPTSERLYVQGKSKDATTLLLRSLEGKELLRKEFPVGTTLRELDVSNLSKGIYLLEIQTSSGRKFTEKVVIE